jgi:hypothetical protein
MPAVAWPKEPRQPVRLFQRDARCPAEVASIRAKSADCFEAAEISLDFGLAKARLTAKNLDRFDCFVAY